MLVPFPAPIINVVEPEAVAGEERTIVLTVATPVTVVEAIVVPFGIPVPVIPSPVRERKIEVAGEIPETVVLPLEVVPVRVYTPGIELESAERSFL